MSGQYAMGFGPGAIHTAPLIRRLMDGLAAMEAKKARVVILRAQPGVKVWCAGHDVHELPLSGRDPLSHDDTLRRLIRSIEDFPAPVIALLEVRGRFKDFASEGGLPSSTAALGREASGAADASSHCPVTWQSPLRMLRSPLHPPS